MSTSSPARLGRLCAAGLLLTLAVNLTVMAVALRIVEDPSIAEAMPGEETLCECQCRNAGRTHRAAR